MKGKHDKNEYKDWKSKQIIGKYRNNQNGYFRTEKFLRNTLCGVKSRRKSYFQKIYINFSVRSRMNKMIGRILKKIQFRYTVQDKVFDDVLNSNKNLKYTFNSVQFSHSVMSHSLWPHESQHARPPCPSPTPGVHSDSHPLSPWCHPLSQTLSSISPPAHNPSHHQTLFQ